MVSKIKALDASVVNKIAAGEIIISPMNALKEMMENSIDAKATTIDILAKEGGIKILQITDNGSGIDKEDLPILCERFTTSKLKSFDDLQNIQTYGFRGEALASISHIARVTVTTKTKNDKCAWKVSYSEGKMIDEPKPIAGKDGTSILVEDLFYNVPSRLRALRAGNEEYNKILDVVGRYAIHSKGIAFSCKKFGESNFNLTIQSQFSIEDRIRTIFNNQVATNLIPFHIDTIKELNIISVTGRVSNLNFSYKKTIQPLFFINNRLITCEPLKRALRNTYSNFMTKGNKPFIYLSILIHPNAVDVNVHPTKREVRFLNQDAILEKIALQLHEELSNIDTSRTFKTATILTGQRTSNPPSAEKMTKHISPISENRQAEEFSQLPSSLSTQSHKSPLANKIKRYESKLVRTDASQAKITSFLQASQYYPNSSQTIASASRVTSQIVPKAIEPDTLLNLTQDVEENKERIEPDGVDDNMIIESDEEYNSSIKMNTSTLESSQDHEVESPTYTIIPRKRVDVNLTSIKELQNIVDESAHSELTNIFAGLTYVGVVDPEKRLAAIQHDLKLFLVDYASVSYELFYQIALTDFANYGKIELQTETSDDLKLVSLLSGFEHLTSKAKLDIINKLWGMKDMLQEYFGIELINEDSSDPANVKIISIPLLLKGYNPPISKLPFFIYRLGIKIDWSEEQACLDGIMKQIALFYVPEVVLTLDENDSTISEEDKISSMNASAELNETLENVIFPSIKRRLLAPRNLLKDIVEIANLPGLYKVFERC
ncbi:hypothetical protein NCAS_0D00900 [Naumovozyma castellii]|uniref:DNA mismatch repair protein S5 domain-containing protein n=1 Tax=Naumovozyma castellii TaxID=27288 RepID=G0VDN3_NAUCA|nr:hypothetical protein NCAS_0D00900 [Naumovozyma castellii CBS 4309]CCC69671.1 hypothetical protein NCAS_0D00900 [Naumovozyma castellii CBS 4309]